MLRAELEGLKLGALIRRAKAAGVAAEQIEEACDAEDSKAAMVELVLSREQGKEKEPELHVENLIGTECDDLEQPGEQTDAQAEICLLYTSPSPRDRG